LSYSVDSSLEWIRQNWWNVLLTLALEQYAWLVLFIFNWSTCLFAGPADLDLKNLLLTKASTKCQRLNLSKFRLQKYF
jgi:hypothetical protein